MASLSFSYVDNEQNNISPYIYLTMTYDIGDDAGEQHRLLMFVRTFLERYQRLDHERKPS